MSKILSLLLILFAPSLCLSAEHEKSWLGFNEYVEANLNKVAHQETLLTFLNNPDPVEVEFGIRFSINRYERLNAAPVFNAIWENNQKAFPSIDMGYLRQPTILLAVAAALSRINQCKNDEYREYVIRVVDEGKPMDLPFAILALGYVGTKNDLFRLVELAKIQDGEYLFQASSSILEIDAKDGVKILKELRNMLDPQSDQAKLIDQLLNKHKPSKARNSDGCACPSRKYVLPDILDLFQRRRQSGVLGHC